MDTYSQDDRHTEKFDDLNTEGYRLIDVTDYWNLALIKKDTA
jgi:hypothetical protein